MSRIDFAFGAPDRLRTACEVVNKHYLSGRQLVIYAQDAPLLTRFDQFLWSFDATAFVPHVDAADPLAAQTPILLTSQPPTAPTSNAINTEQAAWLINLSLECPPNAEQFERVLEIVSTDPDDVQAARQRWRQYKADGHTVLAHDISART